MIDIAKINIAKRSIKAKKPYPRKIRNFWCLLSLDVINDNCRPQYPSPKIIALRAQSDIWSINTSLLTLLITTGMGGGGGKILMTYLPFHVVNPTIRERE
jgi:hypothetical protein